MSPATHRPRYSPPPLSRLPNFPMCPRRLRQDINGVLQSQEILQSIGVTASLASDDEPGGRRHLIATIDGPQDTVYEGKVYVLDVLLSQGYPFDPPQMIFATEIDHPHVCQETGQVNLVRALFVLCIESFPQSELDSSPCSLCRFHPVQRSGPPQATVLF